MSDKIVIPFVVFVLILLAVMLTFSAEQAHHSHIHAWAVKQGTSVVKVESCFWTLGPFWYKDKNQRIYKVTLEDGRTAWMRTGLFVNDWICDECPSQ